MSTRRKAIVILALTFCLGLPCRAMYPVMDFLGNSTLYTILGTNVAQKAELVKSVAELKKQVEMIQSIERILKNPGASSLRDVDSILKGLPGGSAALGGLFSSGGYLDVFMDMTPTEFKESVTDPAHFASSRLMAKTLGVTSDQLEKMGWKSAETSMSRSIVQNVSRGNGLDANTGIRVADLFAMRILNGMENDRKRLDTLSKVVSEQNKSGQQAAGQDLSSQLAVVNQQANTSNNIALEQMRQQNDANAATAAALTEQTKLLSLQEEKERLNRLYGNKP